MFHLGNLVRCNREAAESCCAAQVLIDGSRYEVRFLVEVATLVRVGIRILACPMVFFDRRVPCWWWRDMIRLCWKARVMRLHISILRATHHITKLGAGLAIAPRAASLKQVYVVLCRQHRIATLPLHYRFDRRGRSRTLGWAGRRCSSFFRWLVEDVRLGRMVEAGPALGRAHRADEGTMLAICGIAGVAQRHTTKRLPISGSSNGCFGDDTPLAGVHGRRTVFVHALALLAVGALRSGLPSLAGLVRGSCRHRRGMPVSILVNSDTFTSWSCRARGVALVGSFVRTILRLPDVEGWPGTLSNVRGTPCASSCHRGACGREIGDEKRRSRRRVLAHDM